MTESLFPNRQGQGAGLPAIKRLEEQYIPEPNSGCWLWIGVHDGKGYGQISIDGRTARAHRFSYEAHKGPIPDGMYIDHLCRMPSCVNPDHLEAVSPKENCMSGIKCEYCGRFIAYADFDEDRVGWTPVVAAYTDPLDAPEPTEPAPICPKCQNSEKVQ